MAASFTYGVNGSAERTSTPHIHNPSATERTALLPTTQNQKSTMPFYRRLHTHLVSPISQSHTDLILLLSYTITGLLDSTATVLWGSFVSMQTGNSIYLGLGFVDPTGSRRWIKSLLSIISFCAGSFLFSRFHRISSASLRQRWVMVTAFGIQTALITAAALIVHFTVPVEPGDKHDLHWHVLVPLCLVAAQSAGQTVASRALGMGTLTSTVLTSIYCDLWGDQKLFVWPTENADRNRRMAAPLLLILGAMLGGLWAKTDMGLEGALWMAAGMKGAIVLAWMAWAEEDHDIGRTGGV